MTEIVIWGAGGHGRVVAEAALAQGVHVVAVLDDCPTASENMVGQIPVCYPDDRRLRDRGYHFAIAIGNNADRAVCFARALTFGWEPARVVHPSAVVSPQAEIGAGTVVLPRAVLNAGAVVGMNCIINSGAIVEHDCRIDDHVHIAPGAVLGGGVEVGTLSLVGMAAAVLPLGRIGAGTIIGAGAVVLSTIPNNVTAAGIPARVLGNPTPRTGS